MTISGPRPSLLARLRTPEPAPPWSTASALLTAVGALLAFIAGTFFAQVWLEGQVYALLAGWALGGLLTVIFVLRQRRAPQQRAALRLAGGTTPLPFIVFLSFGAALALDLLAISVTSRFLPAPALLGIGLETSGAAALIFAALFVLIAQPLAEELVFRGVALPALRTALGARFGLVATAALSAVFHLLIYPASYTAVDSGVSPLAALWYSGVTPFLAALVFGSVRVVTGSTRLAIAAHVAFGLFALLRLLAGF
jgi:membrane protease YdiL (CAAX protease family)